MLPVHRASYEVEAQLIGYPDLPPLKQAAEDIAACGEEIWLCDEAGELVGGVGLEDDGDVLVIARLFVAPRAFRRGVGTDAVRLAVRRAGGRALRVGTGSRNAPALALYEREGFVRQDPGATGYVLLDRAAS
ncbi:MAG: GNAT family N-acetyltransferase [Solirubrobacteraceae bacterium]